MMCLIQSRLVPKLIILSLLLQATSNAVAVEKVIKTTKPAVTLQAMSNPKQQMAAHTETLRRLMILLYELHPKELSKSTNVGPREMTEWVFDGKANWSFDAIRKLQGKEALALLFDPSYQADLVLPLVVGLETLLFKAYGGVNEFQLSKDINIMLLAQARCVVGAFEKQWLSQSIENLEASPIKVFLVDNKTANPIQGSLSQIMSRIETNRGLTLECGR